MRTGRKSLETMTQQSTAMSTNQRLPQKCEFAAQFSRAMECAKQKPLRCVHLKGHEIPFRTVSIDASSLFSIQITSKT